MTPEGSGKLMGRCLPRAGEKVANHSYFPILVDPEYRHVRYGAIGVDHRRETRPVRACAIVT